MFVCIFKGITCPDIFGKMKNGKCFGSGTSIGSRYTCLCDDGFYMKNRTWGNKIDFMTTTCSQFGDWTEQIPTCIGNILFDNIYFTNLY